MAAVARTQECDPGDMEAWFTDEARIGWHLSARLDVPATITIVPLPAKCPELNPQENVWQFLRNNWLSNRVLGSCNIVDHCCHDWNRLADQPWKIMARGAQDWAHKTGHTGSDP